MKKIGFVGLGKMGIQIVQRFLSAGIPVVVFDKNTERIAQLVDMGAHPATSEIDLIHQLGERPIIWLMIPSSFVDDVLGIYVPLLPKNATIIDGGNSDFRKTLTRAEMLKESGIGLIDVGTSGGVMGLTHGFSLMIGSTESEYEEMKPLFDALITPEGGYARMGTVGYGHYVKMVHNGIEYAMMQSLAEGYQVLREGTLKNIPLAQVAEVWQRGSVINSTLNGLIEEIVAENPDLEGIDGYVASSGEGEWTRAVANEYNIPTPALISALHVREESQKGNITFATKLLAAMRNKFGGHLINKK